jgi:hypothetical protein
MLFNPVLSYRNKFPDKFYLDSRPIRDVSFRFSTNERRFISISDQWDVFYFDSRPMRYVLFRYPTNKRRLISIPDQSGMFHLDFWPMRDALFRCATNEMFYFDSQPMKDVLFRFANLSPKCCIELTTLVVIGTSYTGSWKTNYYAITTTTSHTNVVIYLKITEWKRKTTGVFNNDNLFANRNKTSFIGCESK